MQRLNSFSQNSHLCSGGISFNLSKFFPLAAKLGAAGLGSPRRMSYSWGVGNSQARQLSKRTSVAGNSFFSPSTFIATLSPSQVISSSSSLSLPTSRSTLLRSIIPGQGTPRITTSSRATLLSWIRLTMERLSQPLATMPTRPFTSVRKLARLLTINGLITKRSASFLSLVIRGVVVNFRLPGSKPIIQSTLPCSSSALAWCCSLCSISPSFFGKQLVRTDFL